MKKLIVGTLFVGAAMFAQAAYQVYDVKLTLTTTKNITVALPYPLNQYFYGSTAFRAKVKENLTGMAVCWGADELRSPSFVCLTSSLTGKTYTGGSDVDGSIYWNARSFSRLSPKDTTVETCIDVQIDNGSDWYVLTCAGVGKVKAVKYRRWWRSGMYAVSCVDAFKGNAAGTKSAMYSVALMTDGETENYDDSTDCGTRETAVYGTWTIKFNKKYSDALYKLSTRNNSYHHGGGGIEPGVVADGDDDEGEELSASEIASVLGL